MIKLIIKAISFSMLFPLCNLPSMLWNKTNLFRQWNDRKWSLMVNPLSAHAFVFFFSIIYLILYFNMCVIMSLNLANIQCVRHLIIIQNILCSQHVVIEISTIQYLKKHHEGTVIKVLS